MRQRFFVDVVGIRHFETLDVAFVPRGEEGNSEATRWNRRNFPPERRRDRCICTGTRFRNDSRLLTPGPRKTFRAFRARLEDCQVRRLSSVRVKPQQTLGTVSYMGDSTDGFIYTKKEDTPLQGQDAEFELGSKLQPSLAPVPPALSCPPSQLFDGIETPICLS